MIKSRIFLILFFPLLLPYSVFASGIDISALKGSWNNPGMSHCGFSDLKNATIGKNKDVCRGGYNIDDNTPSQCSLDGSNMGVLMLVAREVNEHGAYFCPTTIHAKHRSWGNAWTLYAESAQGAQPCYWLCKAGYSGEGCSKTTPDGCDSVPLNRDDFDNLTMSDSPQVESVIPMFHLGEREACGVNYNQEHDMILAVSDWLSSGHGAWASPFVVRARRESYNNSKSGVEVWPVGEATLLCKNGYIVNKENNDCIAIDEAMCAINQMCPDWPSSAYNGLTMVVEYYEPSNCYKYRCIEKGYAFASSAEKTCSFCTTNIRNGVSPEDGTCIKCDVGKIFNENAKDQGYCSTAVSYINSDLQYGKGKNKSIDINQQCWTSADLDPTDYINCVKGTANNTTGASTGATSNTFVQAELPDTNTDSGLSINNINTAGNVIGTTMGVAGIMPAN